MLLVLLFGEPFFLHFSRVFPKIFFGFCNVELRGAVGDGEGDENFFFGGEWKG